MSHGGSEPAGLHGLKEKDTEAKEGPLELKRKKANVCALRERRGGKVLTRETERESEHRHWVLCLKGFYLEVSGEHHDRIFINFSGVSLQGGGLH